MPRRIATLSAGLTAALALSFAITGASASRLQFGEQRFRMVWGSATFEAEGTVACPLTLEGSFHSRTFTKTFNSLIGYITAAATNGRLCINGPLRLLTETLPWHVRYGTFTGTLPRISEVVLRIVGMKFLTLPEEYVSCLTTSEAAEPVIVRVRREAGGIITEVAFDSTFEIREQGGILFCNGSTRLTGTGDYALLGTTQRDTLTLI